MAIVLIHGLQKPIKHQVNFESRIELAFFVLIFVEANLKITSSTSSTIILYIFYLNKSSLHYSRQKININLISQLQFHVHMNVVEYKTSSIP